MDRSRGGRAGKTAHRGKRTGRGRQNCAHGILEGVSAGRKFSDYAILYRMNSQSAMFERMFAKQGIPHRIIGGTRFFDRKEVRDMISYLSVVNNPGDEIRLRRVINTPKRGIGDRTVDTAAQIGQQVGGVSSR